jgi:hypothetical protein
LTYFAANFGVGFHFINHQPGNNLIFRIIDMLGGTMGSPYTAYVAILLILGLIFCFVSAIIYLNAMTKKSKKTQMIFDFVTMGVLLIGFFMIIFTSGWLVEKIKHDYNRDNNNSNLAIGQILDAKYLALYYCMIIIPFIIVFASIATFNSWKLKIRDAGFEVEEQKTFEIKFAAAMIGASMVMLTLLSIMLFVRDLLARSTELATWDWSDFGKNDFKYKTEGTLVFSFLAILEFVFVAVIASSYYLILAPEVKPKVVFGLTIFYCVAFFPVGIYYLVKQLKTRGKINEK